MFFLITAACVVSPPWVVLWCLTMSYPKCLRLFGWNVLACDVESMAEQRAVMLGCFYKDVQIIVYSCLHQQSTHRLAPVQNFAEKMGATEDFDFGGRYGIHHRPGKFFFEARKVPQKIFFRWWSCTFLSLCSGALCRTLCKTLHAKGPKDLWGWSGPSRNSQFCLTFVHKGFPK